MSVTQKDKNPPESTILMVSKAINQKPHAITFHKEGQNGQMDYKFTKRRIYSTEAAPGGVYWFMSNGGGISLYNAYPNDPSGDVGFCTVK